MIDLVIKLFGMELHEITASVVLLGTLWLVTAVIRIKYRLTKFERNDLEEKLLMAQTAELLRKATVETAANLRDATIQTAKHLKETTTETARILGETSAKEPCEILESINKKLIILESLNEKFDKLLDDKHTKK